MMKLLAALALVFCSLAGGAHAADPVLAPTGVLRAAYLDGNPAQAVKDPATGELKGVAVDLGRELARRASVEVRFLPQAGVQAVIEAVQGGRADIGFIASDPARRGPVEFSQAYLRNPQGLAAPRGSVVTGLADLKKPGLRIGVTRGNSIDLYLTRTVPHLTLVRIDTAAEAETRALLQSGRIDAFAGNRLRLQRLAADIPGVTLFPGAIMGVPQAIAVPAAEPQRLAVINTFLDNVRASGLLAASIARAANGTEIADKPD